MKDDFLEYLHITPPHEIRADRDRWIDEEAERMAEQFVSQAREGVVMSMINELSALPEIPDEEFERATSEGGTATQARARDEWVVIHRVALEVIRQAIEKGCQLGWDLGSGAERFTREARDWTGEERIELQKLQKKIIKWFKADSTLSLDWPPSMKGDEARDCHSIFDSKHLGKLRTDGKPWHFFSDRCTSSEWQGKLRQLHNQHRGENPWTAWRHEEVKGKRGTQKRYTLMREIDSWVRDLQRQARVQGGVENLRKSGAELTNSNRIPWRKLEAEKSI